MGEGWEKIIAAVGSALAAVLAPAGVIYAASVTRSNKAAEATVATLTADVEYLEERLEAETVSGRRWYEELVRLHAELRHERAGRLGERQALIRQNIVKADAFLVLDPIEPLQAIIDRSNPAPSKG